MKKISVLKKLLAVCITSMLFVGCTNTSTSTVKEEKKTIKVTDVKGEVEIPANPERIVDLSGNSDVLSILGYKVIGTANSDAYDYKKFPTYLEDTLNDATILGYSMQDTMDVEAIMNLNPDLIVISTVQEKLYDQLSEIAPTVMIKLEALNWKDDVKTFAKTFNKEKVANNWLENYDKKAKEVGNKIKEAQGTNTTYLSFLASGGQFYVFDGAGFGSVLYEDLGLSKPEGMPEQTDISLPVVTYEGLAKIMADNIFVIATDEDLKVLEGNALWNNIPAAKNGKVIKLPSSPYFIQGYSSIGREKLLDEIMEKLNEKK
jgi:iron complex transport system substrate-binding protein